MLYSHYLSTDAARRRLLALATRLADTPLTPAAALQLQALPASVQALVYAVAWDDAEEIERALTRCGV